MAAPEAIREALDRVSASREFSTSPRLAKFLRYIVEETLEGRSAEIKEYSIGLQVLGRGSDFDPKSDAIVRVEAGRLRARLALYYASAGRGDSIRFLVPTGGYVPQISEEQPAPAAPASAPSHETPQTAGTSGLRKAVPWRWLAVAAAVAAVSGVVVFQMLSRQPAPLSIAVLPVVNQTGDSSRDTYAAGIAEDVAAKLAQEQGLGVERVSRGGETAVRSRCRLSLTLQAGPESRLRLIASLDDSGRKTQIWGQSYSAGDWDANQFRDLASELLARTLHRMFGGLSLDAIEARSRHNQEALDLYVRGYQEWLTQRRPGIEKSIELYRQAVAREPGFSDAWAALGASTLQLANSEPSRADGWSAEARAALTKALATDDRNAEAHARLGNIYMTDWDFTSAVRELRRAAELRPGNSAPARWLSMVSSLRGLDARRELEFGLIANPGSDAMPAELGRLEFEAGRLDRAEALARQSLRADRNYGPSFFLLALVAERRGDLRLAQSYFESCAPLRGWEFDCAASLARLRGEHFGIAPPDANSFPRHYSRALIHLARKDRAAAARELEAGIDAREPRIEEFVLDPQFRPLLSIPSLRAKVSAMRVVLGS